MASKLRNFTAVDEDPKVDSSSMIDMVFQLILFFMVSSRLVTNQFDPRVDIPVASNAKPPEQAAGRIVVHIYEDGTFSKDDKTPLADPSAITDYVMARKDKIDSSVVPKVLLRGDKNSVVKYSKQVVKAAGDAGVNTVIFSAYPSPKKSSSR